MLPPAVNKISSTQAKLTTYTEEECQQILDYVAMYLNVFVHFYASNTVLMMDSDAAYLVMPNTKSRIAGYFQLSDYPTKTNNPKLNGTILVVYKVLKNVISSSAKYETVGLFYNAQMAMPIRYMLEKLNYT